MPLAVNHSRAAIRDARGHFLRELPAEIAVLSAVPDPHRHTDFLELEAPWRGIDSRIVKDTVRMADPCAGISGPRAVHAETFGQRNTVALRDGEHRRAPNPIRGTYPRNR